MSLPLKERSFRREAVSLAPMIDKTHRDWRRVMRMITQKSLLYTEMLAAPAVIRGNRSRLLDFDPAEHPLCLQLGWDVPEELAEAARIGEDWGYDEINLNVGCPSTKVQRHNFGACLMARPEHTARIVEAMARGTSLPVTVKHRVGIRSRRISLEDYDSLKNFARLLEGAGCRKFIVHARIAVLEGLSPKENREIPPLRPQDVYRLKEDFPHLHIEINGGYKTAPSVDEALARVDGVMLGRLALDDPWFLSQADQRWMGSQAPAPTRREVLEQAVPYLEERASQGVSLGRLIQPLLNLTARRPGAGQWRRTLGALPAGGREGWGAGLRRGVRELPGEVLDEPGGDQIFPSPL